MSAIIDNEVFPDRRQLIPRSHSFQGLKLATELSKKAGADGMAPVIISTSTSHRASNRLHLQGKDFFLQVAVEQQGGSLTVTAWELAGSTFRHIQSELSEREAMQELSNAQFTGGGQGAFYAREGRFAVGVRLTLPAALPRSRHLVDIYNRIIYKNIHRLHAFLTRRDLARTADQPHLAQFREDLTLTKLLHTEANFDFAEEKSQFKQGEAALRQQRSQLRLLQQNIIIQDGLQRANATLFGFNFKETGSAWVKDNLPHVSQGILRKYRNALQMPWLGERKIQDFVFNTVKVELRDRMAKPVAEGGSSLIFLAKGVLSFVSSVDFSSYRRSQERVERLIAVKSLRPGLQGRLREKLDHERKVVARMHGGCCFFLPKYYGTEQGSELSHYLLMEYINGEPLQAFIKLRRASISFRTKVYLMLNILFGMRFLISREIVHLDLKPSNIVVCKQLIPKIMDFGEAYHRELCPKNYCPGFTFPYVAPQVYAQYESRLRGQDGNGIAFSEKQDVFAFGMMMQQVFFNGSLFSLDILKYRQIYSMEGDLNQRIFLCGQRLSLFGEEPFMSVMMLVIGRCLSPHPSERPKFDWIGVLFKLLLGFNKSH